MSSPRFTASLVFTLATAAPAGAQFVLSNSLGKAMDDAAITPDGRYAVVSERGLFTTQARVYDLTDGSLVAGISSIPGIIPGPVHDGVAVTDERAVVLLGAAMILDLSASPPSLLAEHDVGLFPHDVAITPDGSLAAVRGGHGGGQYVFDLASGVLVGFAPGEPSDHQAASYSFDVDSVGVTDEHAIFTSLVGTLAVPRTRVTVWDLHPPSGPPAVVFETGPGTDLLGAPHDVAVTPGGAHAAVRAELSIALFSLSGTQSGIVWAKRPFGNPGPFGNSAMDSVEVTDERVATISRWTDGTAFGAQVDVFDLAGDQKFEVVDGDPHDLAITPDGERLIVRTHLEVFLYDLVNLPPGDALSAFDSHAVSGTHTSFGAGLDSIAVTDSHLVILNRFNNLTKVRFYDLTAGGLVLTKSLFMQDRPLDLEITPDETKVAIAGLTRALVFDLRTGELLLEHDPIASTGGWPWSDGVALSDDTLVAFGYSDLDDGWVSVIDLFTSPSNYCVAAPNSTGLGAHVFATGSARVAANDLTLWATQLPFDEPGVFIFGDGTDFTPFGEGFLCVGGQTFRFDVIPQSGTSVGSQVVDYTSLPPGAVILPGSTFFFQYWYRDAGFGGAAFNLSEGLAIQFE